MREKSIDEAKERVRAAIINTDYRMPDTRITINLAPADIPKEGSGFDLPIAIGILAASGMIDKSNLKDSLFFPFSHPLMTLMVNLSIFQP